MEICKRGKEEMPDLKKQLEDQVKRLQAVQAPVVEVEGQPASIELEKFHKLPAGASAPKPPPA